MTGQLTILVTAVSGTNTGTQIFEALEMANKRYNVITADISPKALASTLPNTFYTLPPAKDKSYLHALLEVCKKEHVRAVAPGSEPELSLLVQKEKELEAHSITLLANTSDVVKICQDKIETIQFLSKHNFPYLPTTIIDFSQPPEEMSQRILSTLRLPIVLKPYRNTGGSNNVYLIQERHELSIYHQLLKHMNIPFIAQEYDGNSDNEYTVGVMSGPDGQAFSSFALKRKIDTTLTRKLHEKNRNKNRIKDDYLTISSGISQGFVDDYLDIRLFCQTVANTLGSTGPLNIQCRKTDRGIMIFEINPRFSGTTSIRALCGHNDLDLIIRRHIYNENVSQPRYKRGLVIRSLHNRLLEIDNE